MRILGFGGCRVNHAIQWAEAHDERVSRPNGKWIPSTFALNEVIQALDIWRGDVAIPAELKPVISAWGSRLVPQPQLVAEADCVLLETSQQVELFVDGYAVNRNVVSDKLLRGIGEKGKDAKTAVLRWYNSGLRSFDDTATLKHGSAVLPLITDDMPDAQMLRYLVANLRGRRADPSKSLLAIRERVGKPIGYITHTWQFMADGRQVHIPEGFYAEILEAVQEVGLPVLFPEQTIREFGVARAMRDDLRHYSEEFIPTISMVTIDFAARVISMQGDQNRRDEQLSPCHSDVVKAQAQV